MRRIALLASLAFLFALDAQAQLDHPGTTSVSLMLSDLSYTNSGTRSETDAGYAAAVNYWWTPRISTELGISNERPEARFLALEPNGQLLPVSRRIDSRPVDLNVQFHFFTMGPWKPYLGGGLRYLTEPSGVVSQASDRVKPEINSGVVFDITPHVGIKIDSKLLLGSSNWPVYDHLFKASIGVSWRF